MSAHMRLVQKCHHLNPMQEINLTTDELVIQLRLHVRGGRTQSCDSDNILTDIPKLKSVDAS